MEDYLANRKAPWVSLTAFEVDDAIQPRVRLSGDAVRRYADAYRASPETLPPITLGRLPGGRIILLDGFHRVEAANRAHLHRIRADAVDATAASAAWIAVERNLQHGVPIPRSQAAEVFRRFINAERNRLEDGTLMSYRELSAALHGLRSHERLRQWMHREFPKIAAEMRGRDPDEEEIECMEPSHIEHDSAVANVDWEIRQLKLALTKALRHVEPAELAELLRSGLAEHERTIGRPLRTLAEVLVAVHGPLTDDEIDDY